MPSSISRRALLRAGLAVPVFSNRPRFDIAAYGAAPDDQARTSAAIARAIADANAAGGGVVVVPPGTWPTGPIPLRRHVALHVEEGATLLFSGDPRDYLPAVRTSWEGLECMNYSPLVYAYDCENVALTGRGTLRAKLDVWRRLYARPKAHMDALVAWVLHPYLCRDVVIRRVDVAAHGHNNDGIDPEMSENVLIDACVFDQGDDAVSVKSGRDRDAWRIGVPARNIVMRRCRIKNGHQLMAIGSELSGGVLAIETDVLYQWKTLVPTYERRLTPIEGLYVSGIRVDDAGFVCMIKGAAELPVRDVHVRHVAVRTVRGTPVVTENVVGFDNRATERA